VEPVIAQCAVVRQREHWHVHHSLARVAHPIAGKTTDIQDKSIVWEKEQVFH
jgi:hypothetical protein